MAHRAETLRLQGKLFLALDEPRPVEAERVFRRAIEAARGQEAKSYELRATTGLARLPQARGRHDEARAMLGAVYAWFTEGFGTADLEEAQALLDELGSALGSGHRAPSEVPGAETLARIRSGP